MKPEDRGGAPRAFHDSSGAPEDTEDVETFHVFQRCGEGRYAPLIGIE